MTERRFQAPPRCACANRTAVVAAGEARACACTDAGASASSHARRPEPAPNCGAKPFDTVAATTTQRCPKVLQPRPGQRGFSLVGAVFLLTVLAALGTWAVTLSSVQHGNALLGPLSARAHFAARSGVEWAAWQIVRNAAAGLNCPGNSSVPVSGGALTGFSIGVACNPQSVTEGASTYMVYSLDVTASRGTAGAADHVSRTLHAEIAF